MTASATSSLAIAGKPLALATSETSTLVGLDAHPISIEVCCTRGPAFFQMVGLAHAAVREARVRVAGALAGLGVLLDEHAVTLNLAPADLRKTDAALDLAIAVSLLDALGHIGANSARGSLLLGELSLDGRLQPVRGVLPLLEGARARGLRRAIVPAENAAEAALVPALDVRLAPNLSALVAHLRGETALPRARRGHLRLTADTDGPDLSDVAGQATARRALEIAAAGGHNLIMVGSPGGGKTMLARRLPGLLPPLTRAEAIECTAIHSVAGRIDPARGIVDRRPFRAPHHSSSAAALVGGGEIPRPGEISLAHNGVLFLDEFSEFQRPTLESLRQPLEDAVVDICRAKARARFPARALVVAAANPCPCGYAGHSTRACRCSNRQRRAYVSRLSGPILDRLDLHVLVPPVTADELGRRTPSESSQNVRERVIAARALQHGRRARGETTTSQNSALGINELRAVADPGRDGLRLLSTAIERLGLSARAYTKVLRVARTVADLAGDPVVGAPHVAEAIQMRLLDRDSPD